MYKKILVPLENSLTDQVILNHIRSLARLCQAELLLVHVADGFVARNQEKLNLADSEEMQLDRSYLERTTEQLRSENFTVHYELRCGEPAKEILKALAEHRCDLVAMATHGHRLLGDLLLGTVAEKLRHETDVPILMIREPDR